MSIEVCLDWLLHHIATFAHVGHSTTHKLITIVSADVWVIGSKATLDGILQMPYCLISIRLHALDYKMA